ncbi:MAG: threonine/serine dehydratase [Trueperaceae bacterium]
MIDVTIGSVREAAQRVADAIYRTPVIRLPFGEDSGEEIYVKAENLQRTGSFKIRGAYNFLASMDPAVRSQGVVAHSSGNHAQGVACAARLLGVRATIVIPEGAPEIKVERTRSHGAQIVRCGNSSDERERVAAELVESEGFTLVPPFDHPLIVAGQGTVGLEICEALPDVRNVLVPVGGGGLAAGVATAVRALCPAAQVLGVEPELAADATESLAVGRRTFWDAARVTRTVADGVRTQLVGELNFSILQRLLAGMVTVSEEAILEAARWYPREARLVMEPTGALTLAAFRKLQSDRRTTGLLPGKTVLIASGGNIDPTALNDLLA